MEMSSTGPPFAAASAAREGLCGGAVHGTEEGRNQRDGQALPEGLEAREGADARRAVRPHRLEPATCPPSGARCGEPVPTDRSPPGTPCRVRGGRAAAA